MNYNKKMASKIQNINDRIQKYKSLSSSTSNNILTAWQLSSSISNMEQFIKYIEADNEKRQELKKILPYAEKIKRINEEKQYLIKEVKALLQEGQKGYSMVDNSMNKQDEKGNKNSNKLNNTPNIISKLDQRPNTNNSQIKLKLKCQNIIKQTVQNQKRINQIKKMIQLKQEQYLQEKQKQEAQLVKQIQDQIERRKQQLRKKIKQQKTLLKKKVVIHEQIIKFVQEKIQQQINLAASNSEQQQQESKHQNKSISHLLEKQYVQLGQINCKIFSLQDKKRKLTIKHELNKTIKQYELNKVKKQSELSLVSSNKKQIQKQQKKNKQIKGLTAQKNNHHPKGLLSVVSRKKNQQKSHLAQISVLKSPSNKSQTIYNNQTQQKNQPNNDQKSQNQALNNQILLSIIQIKTQILELKQHLVIGFNQNIMNNIISSVKKIQKINKELKQIIQEAIKMKVIFNENFSKLEGGQSQKYEEIVQANMLIKQVPQLQTNLNPNTHYPNTYLSFFINIIQQKLNQRQKLIKNLIISYNYSLKTLKKYYQQKYHRQLLTQIKQLQVILTQNKYINNSNDPYNLTKQPERYSLSSNKKLQNKNSHNNLIIQKEYHSLLNLFNTFQSQIKFISLQKITSLIEFFDNQIVGLVERNQLLRKILSLQQSHIKYATLTHSSDQNNVKGSYDKLVKQILQENLEFQNQIIGIVFKSNKNKKDPDYSDQLNDKNFVSLFMHWYQQFTQQLQTIWLEEPQTYLSNK